MVGLMHDVLSIISERSPHLFWIKDRTLLVILHGSRGYNTHNENSDYDYKGITIPPKEYFFSYSTRFDQAELKKPKPDYIPDATIYNIQKFFNLAASGNPNVIETLHTDESNIVHISELGKELITHREKFLSKVVRHSFSGYALSQLKKIKLHRRWLLNPPKAPPTRKELGLPEQTLIPKDQLEAANSEINKEMDKFSFNFMEGLDESYKVEIRNIMSEMLAELKITSEEHWMAAARKIGLNDNFIEIMQRERNYENMKKDWDHFCDHQKTRNPERYALEKKYGYDCKYAYHLVRLLRMGKEILTTGKVIVKRPDREELLAIRNGAWSYEKLIEFAETEDKSLTEYYKTSPLQHKPDSKFLNKLCMELIERSFT